MWTGPNPKLQIMLNIFIEGSKGISGTWWMVWYMGNRCRWTWLIIHQFISFKFIRGREWSFWLIICIQYMLLVGSRLIEASYVNKKLWKINMRRWLWIPLWKHYSPLVSEPHKGASLGTCDELPWGVVLT
jgi:hypothetical protein